MTHGILKKPSALRPVSCGMSRTHWHQKELPAYQGILGQNGAIMQAGV
jgi:hypothetical protein